MVDMTFLAASDKPDGVGSPDFRARADATSTEHAVIVPERIADLPDTAAYGNILDGTRIRGLRHQQFSEIAAQVPDPICIGLDHHAFFHVERAGSGHIRPAIDNVLDDAQPARAYVRQIGYMAQVGDAEAIFDGRIENTGAFDGVDYGPIDINVHILQHLLPSLSYATRTASNLHSLRQIPHF
jgi:hypothetical protein